ncbi:MAG: GNAT family N-acetyltransferase [Cellulomonadaceae bacterium]|nr:GNAT family N-acetyltransferase [Cellulomonadaceae bacterium]
MIIVREYDKLLVRHSPFECGEEALDRWLKEQAGQADRHNGARTWLGADEAEVRIAGYYSTLAYRLQPEEVGQALGSPRRYPVPAVLLARLAIDRDYQGQGIGKLLLFDALARFARTSHDLGFELVVVDALHEDAACFYLKYGFRRFADHELRLFMTTRDLRATFDAEPS